jgi:signal transduction histidine kinase
MSGDTRLVETKGAERLGGTLDVQGAPGSGTRVCVSMPR